MQLTSLVLDETTFNALPPSWTALRSLRKLELLEPGALDAAGALHPLGSWTQLTSLYMEADVPSCTPGSLEQQLTRLSALQRLDIRDMDDFELPPGRWQGQLTRLGCYIHNLLPEHGSSSSAAAVLAHATALRRVWAWGDEDIESTQPQLRALLGALAALPVLERVAVAGSPCMDREVLNAHRALGSPLGLRLHDWKNTPLA